MQQTKENLEKILKKYKENPDIDPNIYEFLTYCESIAEYTKQEKNTELKEMYAEVLKRYQEVASIVFKRLLDCGIGVTEESPLYKLCISIYEDSLQGKAPEDIEVLYELTRTVLDIMTDKRDYVEGKAEPCESNAYFIERALSLNAKIPDPVSPEIAYVNGRQVELKSLRQQFVDYLENKGRSPLKAFNEMLKRYEENPNMDPNIYSFLTYCDGMVRYLNAEAPNYAICASSERTEEQMKAAYPEAMKVCDKYREVASVVFQRLLDCGIGVTEESPLYQLCLGIYEDSLQYKTPEDIEVLYQLARTVFDVLVDKRDVAVSNKDPFENNKYAIKKTLELDSKTPNPTDSNGNQESLREQLIEFLLSEFTASTTTEKAPVESNIHR